MAKIKPFRLQRLDGGANYREEQSNILDNQSPYMINLTCDDRGALSKRPGQELLFTTSLGPGAIHLFVDYLKKDGTVKTILHHGTKLYTQSGTSQPVEIDATLTLADAKGVSFVFNDIFYYVIGTKIITYDGTNVGSVAPKVPTVAMGVPPAGGGTAFEDFNLLSNSWKTSFSSNGIATDYFITMPYGVTLSATLFIAWVNGVIKIEGVDFTVNRTAGKATWGVAPILGTDNVVIQAEGIGLMDATRITSCLYYAVYGGSNDTRIFLTGGEYNAVYWCSVENIAYWPENNYNFIGPDVQPNTGLLVQYNDLILFKSRSIYRISYYFDGTVATFPSYPVNSAIGCDMPESIQLIDNMPVFCNTYAGVHILTATATREEKNVRSISGNINGASYRPGLLNETKANLLASTSVDYDGKYWLNVGTKVYVWDYNLQPYDGNEDNCRWFPYSNINANCWLIRNRDLFYGKRDVGEIAHITNDLGDFGVAINGIWRSKLLNFGLAEWLKTITEIYFRTRETANTRLTINYYNDTGNLIDAVELTSASFSWSKFSWSLFAWSVHKFPPTFKMKPKFKKVVYFQLEISNNELYQDLSIMDLTIYYNPTKKVR